MHNFEIVDGMVFYKSSDKSYANRLKNGLPLNELIMAELMSPFPASKSYYYHTNYDNNIQHENENETQIKSTNDIEYIDLEISVSHKSIKHGMKFRKESKKGKKLNKYYQTERKEKMNVHNEIEFSNVVNDGNNNIVELYTFTFYSNSPEFILVKEQLPEMYSEYYFKIYQHISKKELIIISNYYKPTYYDEYNYSLYIRNEIESLIKEKYMDYDIYHIKEIMTYTMDYDEQNYYHLKSYYLPNTKMCNITFVDESELDDMKKRNNKKLEDIYYYGLYKYNNVLYSIKKEKLVKNKKYYHYSG
jgi:hypothetical protein